VRARRSQFKVLRRRLARSGRPLPHGFVWQALLLLRRSFPARRNVLRPNYSVKWTAATCHGNLTLTVAAATYLKR